MIFAPSLFVTCTGGVAVLQAGVLISLKVMYMSLLSYVTDSLDVTYDESTLGRVINDNSYESKVLKVSCFYSNDVVKQLKN